jgi:hypothetical protein
MSIRTDLCDYLAGILAATTGLTDIKLVRSVRELGEIAGPVLIVKTDSFEKLAAAPLQKRQGNFTATLISPHQDIDRAEDDLDDRLEILLPTLLTHAVLWVDATQVGYGERNLAYDIRLTSILTNEE